MEFKAGSKRKVPPNLHTFVYSRSLPQNVVLGAVEIRSIEERIRELCERAVTVDDSEVGALFTELKALLAEHSAAARYLAANTLNRLNKAV